MHITWTTGRNLFMELVRKELGRDKRWLIRWSVGGEWCYGVWLEQGMEKVAQEWFGHDESGMYWVASRSVHHEQVWEYTGSRNLWKLRHEESSMVEAMKSSRISGGLVKMWWFNSSERVGRPRNWGGDIIPEWAAWLRFAMWFRDVEGECQGMKSDGLGDWISLELEMTWRSKWSSTSKHDFCQERTIISTGRSVEETQLSWLCCIGKNVN